MKLELKKVIELNGMWYYIYADGSLIECFKTKWYAKYRFWRIVKKFKNKQYKRVEIIKTANI